MRYAAHRFRRSHRKDKNERPLVQLAIQLGMPWQDYAPLDGWTVLRMASGLSFWVPVEIKDKDREGHADEFTRNQKEVMEFADMWGLPYLVWRTESDVYQAARARP